MDKKNKPHSHESKKWAERKPKQEVKTTFLSVSFNATSGIWGVAKALKITDIHLLEQRLQEENITPKAGDHFSLFWGEINILRNGQELASFVLSEHRKTLDTNHIQLAQFTQTKAREGLVSLKMETSLHHTEAGKQKSVPKGKEPEKLTDIQKLIPQIIKDISKSLKINPKILARLVARESEQDTMAISSKNAMWIMQVRGVVFADMRGTYDKSQYLVEWRGVMWYLSYFQKIPDSIINQANPEAAASLRAMKKMKPEERVHFQDAINVLMKNAYDPATNIIVGAVYLSFLANHAETDVSVDRVIAKLDIQTLNHLRVAKGEKSITKKDLEKFVTKIKKDEGARRQFMTLASYNEGTVSLSKPSHCHYYAAAILMG